MYFKRNRYEYDVALNVFATETFSHGIIYSVACIFPGIGIAFIVFALRIYYRLGIYDIYSVAWIFPGR